MKKTKVILALGIPGEADWSKLAKAGMNAGFFRKEAALFIEGIMKSRRGLFSTPFVGLIVFEAAWPLATYEPSNINRQLIAQMENTLNAGKPTLDPRLDWGFNDIVVHANSESPRSIFCMAEMQTKEAMVKMAELRVVIAELSSGIPQDERIGLESRRLMLEMESSLLRDRTVFRMIEHFRFLPTLEERLAKVFVVRGLAHKPMQILFDNSYDVRIKEDKGYYLPRFYKEAMERFYKEGGVDGKEIGRLARLMVAWEGLVAERNIVLSDAVGRKEAEKDAERRCK